jgi:hypothetical protein
MGVEYEPSAVLSHMIDRSPNRLKVGERTQAHGQKAARVKVLSIDARNIAPRCLVKRTHKRFVPQTHLAVWVGKVPQLQTQRVCSATIQIYVLRDFRPGHTPRVQMREAVTTDFVPAFGEAPYSRDGSETSGPQMAKADVIGAKDAVVLENLSSNFTG